MSSQGTGPPSQHRGMKNTTDPRAKETISESAGPVASDSLAAESYNAGEDFAENKDAAPSGVSGESSTFNNTDTSAATKLDATTDSAHRDDGVDDSQLGPGGVKYAEGLGGQPHHSGATTSQGYSGGPTGGSYSGAGQSTSGSGETGSDSKSGGDDSSYTADAAPTYVADVYLGDTNKPKGKNLTEDENLEGNRNTDFEIGGKDDPSRAALQNFENANASISTGQSNTQGGTDGANAYSDLKDDESA